MLGLISHNNAQAPHEVEKILWILAFFISEQFPNNPSGPNPIPFAILPVLPTEELVPLHLHECKIEATLLFELEFQA